MKGRGGEGERGRGEKRERERQRERKRDRQREEGRETQDNERARERAREKDERKPDRVTKVTSNCCMIQRQNLERNKNMHGFARIFSILDATDVGSLGCIFHAAIMPFFKTSTF